MSRYPYGQIEYGQTSDWRLRRRQDIVRRLQAFAERMGRVPTSPELGSGSREERARDLPTYTTLVHHFGSVANALIAAGLTPRGQGDRVNPSTRFTKRKRCPDCGRMVGTHPCRCRQAAATPPRRPLIRRFIWRPDFLLVLEDARAELERLDSRPASAFYVPRRGEA